LKLPIYQYSWFRDSHTGDSYLNGLHRCISCLERNIFLQMALFADAKQSINMMATNLWITWWLWSAEHCLWVWDAHCCHGYSALPWLLRNCCHGY